LFAVAQGGVKYDDAIVVHGSAHDWGQRLR